MLILGIEGIKGIDDVDGDDFAAVLVVGLTSPEGTPPSDGNACPGASMYCELAASRFCVARDTEEFYHSSAQLPC